MSSSSTLQAPPTESNDIVPLPSTTPTLIQHVGPNGQSARLDHPIDMEANKLQSNSESDPSSFPGRPPGLHPLAIPPLSLGQKLYIILPQMIGAAILDGAANFGIGCAMYLNAKNVRIWILKNNTVAGDMAVTIFIQGVLTFCIASGMVHVDLRNNKISAFKYPWPDTSWGAAKRKSPEEATGKISKLWCQFHNGQGFSRGLHFFSGSDVNDIFDSRLSRSQFYTRLCWSIWKGSILSVFYFFLIWPIAIAIVSPIWDDKNLGNRNFTAPIIKAVFGFVYGLLMNPICAMIAMGSEDSVRHHREEKQRERFEHPQKTAMETTAAERVSILVNPAHHHDQLTLSHGELGLQRHQSSLLTIPATIPQRVQSLRRSLNAMDNNEGITIVEAETTHSTRGTNGQQQSGLEWRSAEVHRRRSLDARRTSQGRYGLRPESASSDLTRSASVGSKDPSNHNHLPSSSNGLYVPTSSRSPSSPSLSNNNNHISFPFLAPNRLQTLNEDNPRTTP